MIHLGKSFLTMLKGYDFPNWYFLTQTVFMLALVICTERIVKYSSK